MGQELNPQSLIAQYRIVSKIGSGGMGEVYLAEDTKLDRQVAIKVLHAELAKDADRVLRFVREAKAASGLNHPNILTIHEIGEFDRRHYIATELIKGETLRDRLRHGSLSLRETIDIALQAASALNAAHEAGIVHRDIKPENIMIRDDGGVKILDFGLVKLSEKNNVADSSDPTRVKTSPGTVMGTATYMSPEQARGRETDNRTDIWSLGVVLYEMVAGQAPFSGESTNDTIAAILKSEAEPLDGEVPHDLRRMIRRTLQKRPDERYQTIKDLLLDIRDLKRDLEFSEELERSHVPSLSRSSNVSTGQISENPTVYHSGSPSTQTSLSAHPSSAEYLVTEVKKHKNASLTVLALLVLGTAGFGYWFLNRASTPAISSIAVLPFENKSSDADTEYLSDGLADTLIYRLSQLPNLKVAPRSVVYRYKGKETDPSAIGKELNVDAIMSGRILQRGDRLTISVEIVDIRHNKLIWGEQYDRKLSELLATQREIAKEIVDNLKLTIAGEAPSAITKQYTQNNEAYQLYLKGRYNWNKRTDEGNDKAIEFLHQAIELDPNFALAYVGLAEAHLIADIGSAKSVRIEQGRSAAQKALDLDPSLGEAHNALANIKFYYDWDFAGGEAEWRRAIQLSPNYLTARHWYAEAISTQGRFDESFAEYDRALELDPLSLPVATDRCLAYRYARQYDRAIACLKKLLDVDPNFVRTHYYLGQVYETNGQFEEALNEFEAGDRLLNKDLDLWAKYKPLTLSAIRSRGEEGYWQESLRVALKISAERKKEPVDDVVLAQFYSELNDRDKAFEILNRMLAERNNNLVFVKIDPYFDKIRDDPRFAEIVRKVGIP